MNSYHVDHCTPERQTTSLSIIDDLIAGRAPGRDCLLVPRCGLLFVDVREIAVAELQNVFYITAKMLMLTIRAEETPKGSCRRSKLDGTKYN